MKAKTFFWKFYAAVLVPSLLLGTSARLFCDIQHFAVPATHQNEKQDHHGHGDQPSHSHNENKPTHTHSHENGNKCCDSIAISDLFYQANASTHVEIQSTILERHFFLSDYLSHAVFAPSYKEINPLVTSPPILYTFTTNLLI